MDHMDMDGDDNMPMPSNMTKPFCSGMGMAMYMNGMKITNPDPMNICIIFVFKNLVLDTQFKYFGAIMFTVVWAFFTECVRSAAVILRQSWMKSPAGNTLIFTMQMVMAYLIMLVVMTYDAGMFVAVIFGLSIGHFFVELVKKSQRLKRKVRMQERQGYRTINGDYDDDNNSNNNDIDINNKGDDNDDDNDDDFIDEGTPCCPPLEVELD